MKTADTSERLHLGTLVADMARWGDRAEAVVVHRGIRRHSTSYGELARLAQRFAAELERRDIGPGERVVLWGANSAAWIAAFFGCVLRGVLPVPLDATGTPAFAQRILGETNPRMLVGDRELLGSLKDATGAAARSDLPALLLEQLAEALPAGRPASEASLGELNPDAPLQILFTSGTTGEPKGVVQTHRNLLASLVPIEREIRKYRRYERWVHPLRILHTLPLSHVFGQFMGLWVPPLLGATVHYESRVTGGRLATLIPRERIHVLAAVPRTLDLLRSSLLAGDPALAAEITEAQGASIARRWWRFRAMHRRLGLRFWAVVCGGATLPAELEQFWTAMGFALVQGYGLTETAALVTLNHPFRTARGSLGKALPGRSLRLSATGELEVQGEMVSTSSWQNGRIVRRVPAAAADGGAWLATGDLAAIGTDGQVRFLGRTGQRLVTPAGLNVYLQDLEDVLARQPEVREAVVSAVPLATGEQGAAAVFVTYGGEPAAAAAVARANASLAAHQQLQRWWLWPELQLPRTATGKLRRQVVAEWVAGQMAGQVQGTARDGARDGAIRLLESAGAWGTNAGDEARLEEEWGLDSMGRVALAAALEQQPGLEVREGEAANWRTLGDIRTFLGSAPQAASSDGGRLPAAACPKMPAGNTPLFRYNTWPWWAAVAAARVLFVEIVLRPMVAVLAAPRVCAHSVPTRQITGLLTPSPGAVPGGGPLIIISNHGSAMDVPLLLYALPPQQRRRVAVAMSGEMLAGWQHSWQRGPLPAEWQQHRRWWGPPAAFLLQALLNVFPLPRTAGFRDSFAHAGRAIERGYTILIFPEGRRAPTAEMLPFRPGLGILVREAEVPVLPMALDYRSAPGRRWFRSQPVVHRGQALLPDGRQDAAAVTTGLQEAVETLLSAAGDA